MEYYKKYLKYKSKYMFLKKYQVGGGNIIISDGISFDKTNIKLSIMYYDITNDTIKGTISKSIIPNDINLENGTKIEIDDIIYQKINYENSYFKNFSIEIPSYILQITYNNNIIELTPTHKIFILKFIKNDIIYKLQIMTELNNLDSTNYYSINDFTPFILDINNNIFGGVCKIIKLENKKKNIIFNIERINDSLINITNIINFNDFEYNVFNFQESYDKLKKKYDFCNESTILYKHIYNTFFTNKMLINYDNYIILQNNFGKLLEKCLFQDIINNEMNIKEICSTDVKRINLLQNTMKRIDTSYTNGFLIKDSKGDFIKLEDISPFKIIFDTGNATPCIIHEDFVKLLKLPTKETFKLFTQGASGHPMKYNSYVEIEIKIDPEMKNYNINKIFKFRAYVHKGMGIENTLLLGQASYSLKSFYDNSYCIGFDTDKNKFTSNKTIKNINRDRTMELFTILYDELINKTDIGLQYSDLEYIYLFLNDIDDINNIFTYAITDSDYQIMDNLYNKIYQIKERLKLLKIELDKKSPEIIDKLIEYINIII
jgi:hypothetical protein